MNTKHFIWIGVIVGTTIGGMIPMAWGGDVFGFASIIGTFIGGILGIWAGYQVGTKYF